MANATKSPSDFDLRPDPRILPMLGEINLDQWQALAELIDNAVDGFLTAAEGDHSRQVIVSLPTSNVPNAQVLVRDNGPGMSSEVLEKAVRAGWSGSTSPGTLGMFGMGFNIATARLGTVTTVWTATRGDGEWHGLRVDFAELATAAPLQDCPPHASQSRLGGARHRGSHHPAQAGATGMAIKTGEPLTPPEEALRGLLGDAQARR